MFRRIRLIRTTIAMVTVVIAGTKAHFRGGVTFKKLVQFGPNPSKNRYGVISKITNPSNQIKQKEQSVESTKEGGTRFAFPEYHDNYRVDSIPLDTKMKEYSSP